MKKYLLLFAGLTFAGSLFSQQIPQYSQYYINPFIYNPSFAGNTDYVNSHLIHRSLFQNFPGAPVTNAFTIEGPLNEKNIGLGLSLFTDASDLISRMGVKTAYSYRIKLNDDMRLNLGLGLGVSDTRVDFSKTIVRDINDPFIMKQEQRKFNIDADFGVGYFWKDLEVSVAVPQLLESKARFESNDKRILLQSRRHILGSVKYNFELISEKGISAFPLVLVRYAPGSPFSYDINAVAEWEDKGWFAISYKSDYAVGINLGVRLNKSLSAGYTYDIITSPIKSYAGMSHEILLGYTFGTKKETVLPQDTATAKQDDARVSELEGVVSSQKQQIDANKAEIDKLRTEIEKFTAGTPMDTAKSVTPGKSGFETSGLTADFADKDGNKVKPGHYLIVGSFAKAENADNVLKRSIEKGYKDAGFIKNTKTSVYYVYVLMSDVSGESLKPDLEKVRKGDAPDSWIYRLED